MSQRPQYPSSPIHTPRGMGPKKASRPKEDDLARPKRREVIHCPTMEGGAGGRDGGKGCQLELLDVIQSDGILSTMYSCRDTVTQRKYLVKRVYLHRMRHSDREYRLRETAIWTGLRHRYILTCFTGWQSGAELWLLSEAASETLEQVVRKKGMPPPQPLYEHWLYQLASALQYLHEFQEKTILHRNLKPSNIMVAPHYVLKLTDFGVSKELEDSRDMTRSCVGTAAIMSPEMVNKDPYSTKTDMWSLGITAVFMATQQDAICAGTFDTLFRKTREGQVRSINGQYSADIEDLVHSLLQVDPRQRPSASQFLTHLRLCSNHCDTPATAHSYPERQTVLQKGAGRTSEHPRQPLSSGSRLRSGSGSNDAQRQAERRGQKTTASTKGAGGGDVRRSLPENSGLESAVPDQTSSTASQATQSPMLRGNKPVGPTHPDSSDNLTSGPSSPAANSNNAPSPPGAESLSLSLVYLILGRKHKTTGQGRGPSRQLLGEKEAKRRHQNRHKTAATSSEQGHTRNRDAGEVHIGGKSSGRTEEIHDDRTSKAPGRKVSASGRRQAEGAGPASAEKTAFGTESSGQRVLPSPNQRHSERSNPTARGETVPLEEFGEPDQWLSTPSVGQHNAGGKTSSDRRNVARPAMPLGEKEPVPFNERRGKRSERINREQIASEINSNDQALTPSRLRGERHRRKSHEGLTPQTDPHYQDDPSFSRRRSEEDRHKAAEKKSLARKAQDEESGSIASGGARVRFPIRRDTFGTVNLDERDEVFWQDYRDADSPTSKTLTSDTMTLSTLTSDASTSDTWTSNDKLINTFPGAFNVSPPADPHLSHQGDRAERRSPVRSRSESDALGDGRVQRRGTRDSGETAPSRSRPDLLEGPVDSWPENMREYWILANDLVERLGVDTFFIALKYASLFSDIEVREWLKERGVGPAGQIMEDLQELMELDDQLDANARHTFNTTLLGRSHVGELPASKPH